MYTARVSVIIPYSRADLVETVLSKLMEQRYPAALTEIIVVGKESSVLKEKWSVTVVDIKEHVYPGKARNMGAQVASGEYLLFLDDDCEPEPDWIEQNVKELQRPEVGAVGGKIAGKSKAFFAQCVDFSSFAFCQGSQRREIQICSASMGVKRALYEELQGFNETLRTCEDIDFCYRIIKSGYITVYQPAIKVLHNHRRKTLGVLLRYSYFFGRVSGLYVKLLHPGMTKRNQILTMLRQPFVYALMIGPISCGITAIIIRANFKEHPKVLLYAPFILLAKMAFHLGVLQWIRKEAGSKAI